MGKRVRTRSSDNLGVGGDVGVGVTTDYDDEEAEDYDHCYHPGFATTEKYDKILRLTVCVIKKQEKIADKLFPGKAPAITWSGRYNTYGVIG